MGEPSDRGGVDFRFLFGNHPRMGALAVSRLKETLAERFPDAQPLVYRTAGALATGIGELDGLLPGGGLPRGQLSVWRPGGGATAVLRAACVATVGRGERAAWVDTTGRILGDDWPAGPLLLRPAGASEALECAEELARCGGFGLVVLGHGARDLPVRLGRSAREGGGVLIAISEDASQGRLRIESSLAAEAWRWQPGPFGEPSEVESAVVEVSARALGWSGQTRFRMPVITHGSRLALDPLLVDRRGAPRRSSWPKGRSGATVGVTSDTTSIKSRNSLLENRIRSNVKTVSRSLERAS
jgi:hypothetical protein